MTNNLFFVTQFFNPEPHPKDIKYILDLKEKGWEPIVITGFPNYPKGEIYPGYKNRLFSEEELNGVKIIRVLTYCDHSLNFIKRTLNYLVFGLFAALAIMKYGKKNSFYYILQPSPFIIFCAWVIRLFKTKSTILLDIQDVFPDNIKVSGFVKSDSLIKILDFLLDHFYYKSFDLFITNSNSFKKIVSAKGISDERIMTQYNWSMVEKDQNAIVIQYEFAGEGIHIVYAGNIGVHQGLSKLTEGMINVVNKNPDIVFHFFGDGTDLEKLEGNLPRNSNFIFHGRVPGNEIGKYLNAADILFLHLIKVPIYECVIPSKLQAYIEVGKCLLAGVEGEAREFVVENNLGEIFESENNEQFEEALLKLSKYTQQQKQEIERKSLSLYSEKFSRKVGAEKLDTFVREHTC